MGLPVGQPRLRLRKFSSGLVGRQSNPCQGVYIVVFAPVCRCAGASESVAGMTQALAVIAGRE
jgi:hypothetical protein